MLAYASHNTMPKLDFWWRRIRSRPKQGSLGLTAKHQVVTASPFLQGLEIHSSSTKRPKERASCAPAAEGVRTQLEHTFRFPRLSQTFNALWHAPIFTESAVRSGSRRVQTTGTPAPARRPASRRRAAGSFPKTATGCDLE